MSVCLSVAEKKVYKSDSVDCTPPEFIMPGSKDRPLLPLHPSIADLKVSGGNINTLNTH